MSMDTMSRIVLSATGGDQAAREVAKVTKAYKDAGDAAKKVGSKGGPGSGGGAGGPARSPMDEAVGGYQDAFEKAQKESQVRQEMMQRYRESAEMREGRTRSLALGAAQTAEAGAATGAGVVTPLAGAGSDAARALAAGSRPASDWSKRQSERFQEQADEKRETREARQAETGDELPKTMGESMKSAAAVGMGIVGAAFAVGGFALNVISTLAHKEIERANSLWGSGMAQRAGAQYGEFKTNYLEYGREGIPYAAMGGYYNALGTSGGRMGGNDRRNLSTMMGYGIDPSTMGRLTGSMTQAGMGSTGQDYMLGPQTLQQGLMTKYVSIMAGAVERGMATGLSTKDIEGYTRGSSAFLNTMMADEGGGLTFSGAQSAYEGVNQHYSGGAGLQSGEDALLYLQMHKKGQTYLQTMTDVRNPMKAYEAQTEMARNASAGDPEAYQNMLAGLMPEMAPGLLMGMSKTQGKNINGVAQTGRPWLNQLDYGPKSGGAYAVAQGQQAIFANSAEPAAVSILGELNQGMRKIVDWAQERARSEVKSDKFKESEK